MSGTEPFPVRLWLPQIPELRMSVWSLLLGILSVVVVYILLRNTYFGLKIKAVGKNLRAAFLLGIPTWQYMMLSFFVCGLLAGLAGAVQVVAVYHRLIPSISSGYGFLGLLVAMLVNYQAIWAAFIAFFYASLNIGAIQLPIVLKQDSTLSGVLQGMLVLFVLIVEGTRQRLLNK
jgi:simple sugar transport system permease protein